MQGEYVTGVFLAFSYIMNHLSPKASKQIQKLAHTLHKPRLVPVLVMVMVVPLLHVLAPLLVIILAVEPVPRVAQSSPHITCSAPELRIRTRILLWGHDHVVSVRDLAVGEARAPRLEHLDVVFVAVMAATVASTGR
jgi:flagellar biosynthesis protein FlhB